MLLTTIVRSGKQGLKGHHLPLPIIPTGSTRTQHHHQSRESHFSRSAFPRPTQPRNGFHRTMASNGVAGAAQSMESLTASLKRFGINSVPTFANTFPTHNAVDVYRAHIATILAPLAGVAPEVVYPALQWTTTLEKGDLTLPVPALRMKGKKPDEVAASLEEQVSYHQWTM